ncbi:MAG: hypothetical protein ACKPKO_59080, partial [Candidatus Fonsibacter sp.]
IHIAYNSLHKTMEAVLADRFRAIDEIIVVAFPLLYIYTYSICTIILSILMFCLQNTCFNLLTNYIEIRP